MAIELHATRESNAILGNYYRVTAWDGASYLGEQIYAGYTKRESIRRARERVREQGGLGIWARQ